MKKYIDAEKLLVILERQNVDKRIIDPLIKIIDSLQQEQPPLPDLNEAAEKYAYTGIPDEMKCVLKPVAEQVIKNFIAGAEWAMQQLKGE